MCKDKFHTINKLYLMFLMLSFLCQHAKKGLQTLQPLISRMSSSFTLHILGRRHTKMFSENSGEMC